MIMRSAGNSIEISAPAKINLFLELLTRRSDGYHEVATVMSCVSIYDSMRMVRRSDGQIQLTVDSPHDPVPRGPDNLVVRALETLKESCGRSIGMTVQLYKRIPIQAGLGGASSDAAAALVGANLLWNLHWPLSKLWTVAEKLGSDVPFFLTGGVAVCTGRGEKVQRVEAPSGMAVVVAKPREGLSTAKVYENCRVPDFPFSCQTMVRAICTGQVNQVGHLLWNRLEQVAAELSPAIVRLRDEFKKSACLGHQLSGSGTSYFGVYSGHRVAKIEAKRLSNRLPDVRIFCSQTLNRAHFGFSY